MLAAKFASVCALVDPVGTTDCAERLMPDRPEIPDMKDAYVTLTSVPLSDTPTRSEAPGVTPGGSEPIE